MVLCEDGEVPAVIPRPVAGKEVALSGLTRLKTVDSMHERKAYMGGRRIRWFGCLGRKLVKALTWLQLGFRAKPCALLNVAGYCERLIAFLNPAVDEQIHQYFASEDVIGWHKPANFVRSYCRIQPPFCTDMDE